MSDDQKEPKNPLLRSALGAVVTVIALAAPALAVPSATATAVVVDPADSDFFWAGSSGYAYVLGTSYHEHSIDGFTANSQWNVDVGGYNSMPLGYLYYGYPTGSVSASVDAMGHWESSKYVNNDQWVGPGQYHAKAFAHTAVPNPFGGFVVEQVDSQVDDHAFAVYSY